MGFTTGITTRDAGFPALMVLNALFGGDLTSKLFLHVREKLSLCYYASSSVYGAKGILTVSSGIDTCNYQRTRRRSSGSWPPARPRDHPGGAEGSSGGHLLQPAHHSRRPGTDGGLRPVPSAERVPLDRTGYRDAVRAVTVADAAWAARQVELDTIFFLKGAKV